MILNIFIAFIFIIIVLFEGYNLDRGGELFKEVIKREVKVMFSKRKIDYIATGWGVAFALLAGLGCIDAAQAEEDTIGADEYRISCLSCHGVGGKGDGSMAKFLTIKPTDLTELAKSNGGQYPDLVAGRFPFRTVFQIIDGRTVVSGHGDRAMPVWGNRYLVEASGKYGPYQGANEQMVRGRILELVYYIQSIQQ